ncbi:MAG: beta-N-acetylhexosaminidase [Clostridia bacterium]|nr:beta-N-acetylhexosaminidase [Clostridia bacterium]
MKQDLVWQVGQRMMVGFSGTEVPPALRDLVRRYKIGNVILFEENVESRAQLRSLCAGLQAVILEETGQPALIAIDQEGGVVSRLKRDCAVAPSAMAVAAAGTPEGAEQAGRITGEELASLGVNFDLAPVLDVNSNPDNPVIGARSYGDTPEAVCAYGTAMIRGLRGGGVFSCAKHFPGHGDTAMDSHLGLPRVDKSLAVLESCELVPFAAAIDAGVDAIMTTHILFSQLDEVPATMSRRILTDILRERMGFAGLIVSDCMMMDAIAKEYGSAAGGAAAAAAGVDLICVSHSLETAEQTCEAILAQTRTRSEREPGGRVEMAASVERILACKARLPKFLPPEADAAQVRARVAQMRALREASLTPVGDAARPSLGAHPLFIGCCPFRTTLASNPVNRTVSFPKEMQARLGGMALETPVDPGPVDIAAAVRASAGCSCIVLCTYNGHVKRGQLAMLRALAAQGLPMIAVALRDPYDLCGLPPGVYGLAAYEYSAESLEAVARALRGGFEPRGRLSVRLEARA